MYGADPAAVVDQIETLSGVRVADDLRRVVRVPELLTGKIREVESADVPGAVELAQQLAATEDPEAVLAELVATPALHAGRDQALRLLRATRERAVKAATAALRRRGGDELVALLQPAHRQAIDEYEQLGEQAPGAVGVPAEVAVSLPPQAQEAWRRRQELAGRVRELEALADDLRGPQRNKTLPRGDGSSIEVTLDQFGELAWAGLPAELADRFYKSHPGPAGTAALATAPSWRECAAAGGTRVLRTRSEALTAAVREWNAAVERWKGGTKDAYGRPALAEIDTRLVPA